MCDLFEETNCCVCYDNVPFRDMTGSDGHLGSDAAVKDKTGQEVRVLDYMWRKYAPHLDEFRPKEGRDKTKCFFLLIFIFIHLHPTARNIRNTLHTMQTGFISESTWRRKLKPMLAKLASVVDEMRWENRLHRDNHSVFFQKGVTGIIDCAPVRVVKPRRSRPSKKLYQPKYKHAVLKIQAIISLKGELIYGSFPHLGTMHDKKIWNKTMRRGRVKLHPKEHLLADPAYIGAPHCLVKYPKHKLCALMHGELPAGCRCNCPLGRLPLERSFNHTLDGVRGRVEKIIGQIVHHKAYNNYKNRWYYNLLVDSVKLTLHTTAVWSRMYPQYPGYGFWEHFD